VPKKPTARKPPGANAKTDRKDPAFLVRTATLADVEAASGTAPPTTLCTGCGTEYAFSWDVVQRAGDTTVRVTGVSMRCEVAWVEAPLRYLAEASASDEQEWAAPLLVERPGSELNVAWEWRAADNYSLHAGSLASLWHGGAHDHAATGHCDLPSAQASLPMPTADSYFLVSANCGAGEGALGRDSLGTERPSAPGCP
jgi:hypothetical protein